MVDTLVIPEMPFYWRTTSEPVADLGDLPGRLPFVFAFDQELGLIIEQRSRRLSELLEDVYRREANVGFLQDGHNLAKGYGEDFWRFLADVLARHSVRRVLEIGCGGCIMLERLQGLGYQVVGIDPSPVASEAGRRKGVQVIEDFFPSPRLDIEPDLIFHVDVLEHVEDPVAFLGKQHAFLRPSALLVVNVPDSTLSIAHGDVSMAMHQHVNMFSDASLSRTLAAAGFDVLAVERSRFGASLYALAKKPAQTPARSIGHASSANEFEQFARLATRNLKSFQRAVRNAVQAGESIGFFMPMRAFPYLATMHLWQGFRLFDNMNAWHRRYFDGLDLPVENQEDLFKRPVDRVFIMSLTFGQEVASAIQRAVPAIRVMTLAELVSAQTTPDARGQE